MSKTSVSVITSDPFEYDISLESLELPTSVPPDLQETVGVSIPVALQ